MKIKHTLLAFLFSIISIAQAGTVKPDNANDPGVWAADGTTFSSKIDVFIDSGDDGDEEDPFVVYIPMADNTDTYYNNITALNQSNIPGNLGSVNGTDQFVVWFAVDLTAAASEKLFLGILDDDDWEIAAINCFDNLGTTEVTNCVYSTANQIGYVRVDLAVLCAGVSASVCNNINNASGSNAGDLDIMIKFDSDSLTVGDPITADENATFYNLNISDKLPGGKLRINAVQPGDEKLTLDISVETTLTQMGSDLHQTIIEYDDGGGALLFVVDPPETSGLINLKNLVNARTYNLRVAPMNKYQIRSTYSDTASGTPQDIEEFLKSQACYLISAGFQKEHYVLDFFRHIRDAFLLQTSWGKMFVDFYYQTAPQYASIIYNSPVLSALIRGISTFMYLVIRYFAYWSTTLLAVFYLFRLRSRA